MKDDRKYLLHILECIQRIEEDVSGGRSAFDSSHMIQDAVLRNLQVIAESTKRLSDPLKATHPDFDWGGIAGFRNFLVHDYLGVDLGIVWKVVSDDVPKLKALMLQMLG
ncbi:MAG: DUF86 domain-containing protein [Acidobacteriia bacterium]|nr:DUF86 domain-containing protein [Terriglobia bacterium]